MAQRLVARVAAIVANPMGAKPTAVEDLSATKQYTYDVDDTSGCELHIVRTRTSAWKIDCGGPIGGGAGGHDATELAPEGGIAPVARAWASIMAGPLKGNYVTAERGAFSVENKAYVEENRTPDLFESLCASGTVHNPRCPR